MESSRSEEKEPNIEEIINTSLLLVLRTSSLFLAPQIFVTFPSISLHQGVAHYIVAHSLAYCLMFLTVCISEWSYIFKWLKKKNQTE